MLDRKQLRDLDIGILVATLTLVVIGIVMIYSATHDPEAEGLSPLVKRQALVALLGLFVVLGLLYVSQDSVEAMVPIVYGLVVLLLLAVLIVGVGKAGEKRWFELGILRFQPSEIAKLATIGALASYLARRKTRLDRPVHLIIPLLIALVPMGLVLMQPDLGTSIMFLLILPPMLYWAGIPTIFLILLVTPLVSAAVFPAFENVAFRWGAWAAYMAGLSWFLYVSRLFFADKVLVFLSNIVAGYAGPLVWRQLEDYQRHRILAFLDPEKYRFSTGYQLIQSKIAVGSGSVLGKGLLQGTQKNFAFLPEQHTDFIFSVVAEELGFLGSAAVVLLYLYLVYRMFQLARQVRNRFASLVIVGIASTLFLQTAINVGVTLGMSPVTGMPLPLISYGGTSLLVTLTSIGIVLGMGLRRMEY